MLNYTAENMQKKDDIEHIRLRYGMYIGSADNPMHIMMEILANSVDEVNLGYGDKIELTLNKDGSITIKDEGRGIPHGKQENGKPIIQSVYDDLHFGGKFDTEAYADSLGQNSVGAKATNALSEYLIASTYREGIKETVVFKRGRIQDYKEEKCDNNLHGVEVTFLPDKEIFKKIEFDKKELENKLTELSYLIPKVSFILQKENDIKIFKSNNGMSDYMEFLCKGKKEIIKNRIITEVDDKEEKKKLFIYMTYTNEYNNTLKLYSNNGANSGGTHLTAFRSAMTRVFNKYARNNNLIKDKEANLTGAELTEGQILLMNLKFGGLVYDGQVKDKVDDSSITPFVNKVTTELIESWLQDNPKDAKIIIEKALEARRAKEAAKKAREAVRKPKKQKGLKAKMQLSDKLIDCTTKDPKNNSLLIVEGLSAGSSAVEARNPKTQAIMMLRGKCISVLKSTKEKVLANKEYNDIITAIGAGFDDNFDVDKMNYDKIVITSDFDSDGQSIELLLITFFFRYMRPLIEAGKLYRAVTPLYIANYKNKDYYLYTEEELAEFRKDKNEKFSLQHIKGLGELDPQDLKKVCFDNELYKRINVSDIKKAEQLLQTLMGKEVAPRKEYIYTYAKDIGFEF